MEGMRSSAWFTREKIIVNLPPVVRSAHSCGKVPGWEMKASRYCHSQCAGWGRFRAESWRCFRHFLGELEQQNK